jgi:cytochrome c6
MNHIYSRLLRSGVVLFGVLLWIVAPLRAQGDSAALYKTKCAGCHGPDGKGETPAGKALKARDFASPEVQKQADKELVIIIQNGKNKMPAYKTSLSDAQISSLVAYIRGLTKKA